jgi:predicted HicB family RNase H-like nuclease
MKSDIIKWEEGDEMAKAQTVASNKYNAKAYDRIALQVKKGEREKLREHAKEHGESLNGFINRAITETVERDNGGKLEKGKP